jgi:hypothetical protein
MIKIFDDKDRMLLIALFSSFTSEVYSYLNILYTLFQYPLNRYYKMSTAQLNSSL